MANRIKAEAKELAPLIERPWTRHYDPGVPASLNYPKATLNQLLDDAAESYPKARATIFFDRVRTYRSISNSAWSFANGLRRLGIVKGDRVALILPNTPQFIIAFFGILRAGGIVVPCNPLYTASELGHQLSDSGARVAVTLSRFYPVVKSAREGTTVEHLIVTNIKEEMPPFLRLLFTLVKERKEGHRHRLDRAAGDVEWAELLSAPSLPFDSGCHDVDVALIQYTGGTTGVSKGAMLSHRALVANTLQCRAWFTNLKDGQDTVMAVMPFFHVYGLTVVMNLAIQGAAGMILEPQFDVERILKDIHKHRPKAFSGAPRIYSAINNSPMARKFDLRSIQVCLSGSAPLMADTHRKFVELTGANLVEGYGLTEAAPVTHCNPIFGKGKQKIGTIGIPFPDVESKIVDVDNAEREMGVGEPGELILRGPQVMDGYYNRPDETSHVLRNGWLCTGDIAVRDEDGYFAVVDRKKEMIIVSGFNVYPREIEEALSIHPAVADATAIGVPHPVKGEEVKAFVVLEPGSTASADDLRAHCAGLLAPYKRPREIEFRDALPKTLVGKTLRRKLALEDKAKRQGASG